jgi:hypothetical protein
MRSLRPPRPPPKTGGPVTCAHAAESARLLRGSPRSAQQMLPHSVTVVLVGQEAPARRDDGSIGVVSILQHPADLLGKRLRSEAAMFAANAQAPGMLRRKRARNLLEPFPLERPRNCVKHPSGTHPICAGEGGSTST